MIDETARIKDVDDINCWVDLVEVAKRLQSV